MTVTAVPLQPVKRSYIVWLWIGIAVLVAGAFLLARQGDDYWSRSQRDSGVITTASGLKYKVLTPGTGPHPTNSDIALINYEGKLRSGTTFQKSPQPVPMSVSHTVPGFSEGIKLMNKDAKFRFWIPTKLGYGDSPPAGAPVGDLVFDVDLLAFLPEAQYQQMMQQQQMMGGGAGGAGGPGGAPGGDIAPPSGQ